jgi:HEAT repeat protein
MLWLDRIRFWSAGPPAALLKEVQPLLKGARNPDPAVRLAAVAALAQEPIALVAHVLLDCLSDGHAGVRQAAAQALQQHADPAYCKHFLKLLKDKNFEVRIAAIQFLGRIADRELAQPLAARLADSDSDVRHAAALALGPMRNPVAIEPLVVLLADTEPVVRHAAAASLEQINRRWVRSDAAKRAFPRLEALCRDPQPWVAAAAQKAVAILGKAKDTDTEFWNRESGIRNL